MKVSAVIAAAGQGKRMGGNKSKQYLQIGDEMILSLTVKKLDQISEIIELIVIVPPTDVDFCCQEILERGNLKKPFKIIPGGKERQDSVYAGLSAISSESDYVLIHDGARPLITSECIKNSLREAKKHGSAVLAVPVKDTIKVVSPDGFVIETPARAKLRAVQTPQVFHRQLICGAYEWAKETGYQGTDDASLVEAMGEPVFLVEGSYENIKITTPEDLLLAEEILRRRVQCG